MTAVALVACTPGDRLAGPDIDVNAADVAQYASNQEAMLRSFSDLAGFDGALPGRGDPRWQDIVLAGMNYSDLQCERFIGTIFRWHRRGEALKQEVTLVAATTTTVLGLVNASQQAMALTAAAFGLTSGTLDNITNSVLFKIEPSRVRQTVEGLQLQYYNDVLTKQYTTRSSAVATIAGYHAICLPANIEAEVNQKIGEAGSVVASGSGMNTPPMVGAPADIAKVSFKFSPDAGSDSIEGLIFSDAARTKPNPQGVARVRECLATLGVASNFLVTDLLYDAQYAELRQKTVACLKSKGYL